MGVVVGCDAQEYAGLYEHHNVQMLLCSVLDEEENQLCHVFYYSFTQSNKSDEMHKNCSL